MNDQQNNTLYPSSFSGIESVLPEQENIANKLKKQQYSRKKLYESDTKVTTRGLLAEKAGVGSETVRKVWKILEVFADDEYVLEKCRSGEIRIHQAYILSRLSEAEREDATKRLREGKNIKNILHDQKKLKKPVSKETNDRYLESAGKVLGHIDYINPEVNKLDPGTEGENLYANLCKTGIDIVQSIIGYRITPKENIWSAWILVVPANTDTDWFQNLPEAGNDGLCFVKGKKQIIAYHGGSIQGFVEEFGRFGRCVCMNQVMW